MDNLTPEQRRRTMSRVRGKDTKPEWIVRRTAHGMGFRYRLHHAGLPGKPDLVFVSRRKVIFVHGCFWHGHSCKAGRNRPSSRTEYWTAKLDRNMARDRRNRRALKKQGWDVLVIWECQLKNEERLRARLAAFLRR
ncbi:MAG: DNA mismatch endonuclease Vsr [bacterium]|nr:DNA mismatch endonuclease Vsr [bacterium]